MAAALDAEGKIVWRKEITPFAFDVAVGTSPVLYGDTVLLQWDQTNKTSRLIALDKKTGEVKWEKKRPDADWTHSTPVLAEVKGKKQLLVASAVAVQGLDPDNGDTSGRAATATGRASATQFRRSWPAAWSTATAAAAGRGSPSIRPAKAT